MGGGGGSAVLVIEAKVSENRSLTKHNQTLSYLERLYYGYYVPVLGSMIIHTLKASHILVCTLSATSCQDRLKRL